MWSSTNILNFHLILGAFLWQTPWLISYFFSWLISCLVLKCSTVHQRETVLSVFQAAPYDGWCEKDLPFAFRPRAIAFHCACTISRKHCMDGKQPSEYGILIGGKLISELAPKKSCVTPQLPRLVNYGCLCGFVPFPQLRSGRPAASAGRRCDGQTSSCPSWSSPWSSEGAFPLHSGAAPSKSTSNRSAPIDKLHRERHVCRHMILMKRDIQMEDRM